MLEDNAGHGRGISLRVSIQLARRLGLFIMCRVFVLVDRVQRSAIHHAFSVFHIIAASYIESIQFRMISKV